MLTTRKSCFGLLTIATVAFVLAGGTAEVRSQVIFNFNYGTGANTTVVNTSLPIAASTGLATLTTNYVANTVFNFVGTPTNALGSDVAGASLGLQNGVSMTNPNGNLTNRYLQYAFSSSGLSGLRFSTAIRHSPSAASQITLSYSLDGTNFTSIVGPNLATNSTGSNFVANSVLLPHELDNAPTAFLRMNFAGAIANTFNSFVILDNTRVSVASVPSPSALLSFALGLPLLIIKLRKRRQMSS